ncbi:MAG TPA: class I SAM-dependent methyltransferase [Terracidiphilus sp.]|nr:class I SAM-dependent methyltransferase [Terracidiphilus sp.]
MSTPLTQPEPATDGSFLHDPDSFSAPDSPTMTFRDPAGQLLLAEGYALRRVRASAAEEARAFLGSELRRELERDGDLVSSEVIDPEENAMLESLSSPGDLWLRHPRIDPISYPWEWTPVQWRAAAELTLRVASKAVEAGWTLKDATPLNVLFQGARPVFVDVFSFERRNPYSSTWLAYGQFVRTFLLPLVAARYLSWPLEGMLFARDGYEPAALYRALPRWRRFTPGLLDVVTLAALFDGKGKTPRKVKAATTHPELATHILHKRLARLGKQIRNSVNSETSSEWSQYVQTASHYQPADVEDKQQFVRLSLEQFRPEQVLDIGANTGTYSLMAAAVGAEVVALDCDTAALERLWHAAAAQRKPITALVANIARPTPAAGWRNREHLSLLDRLSGRFDMVLMLAVIHHLILREQLPLAHIGDLCACLTRRWLIIEWVPPSDPMYQEWLRGRDHLYGHLSEDDLMQAFAPHFLAAGRKALGNGRVLLLLERTGVGMAR